MVFKTHGIEPTFLKLDSWSPGVVFIPIITSNVLNYKKKNRMYVQQQKSFMRIQKTCDVYLYNLLTNHRIKNSAIKRDIS